MITTLTNLLDGLKNETINFTAVLTFIDKNYEHRPTAFKNGEAHNEKTQNQGSAKVFSFAKLHQLSKDDTLFLFAEHYRAVIDSPDGTDHQNIRQFMQHGWSGIAFEGNALTAKV